MRPDLTPTLLVAASLAFLPAVGSAQSDGGKPSSSDTAPGRPASAGMAADAPSLSEQEKEDARRIARFEREKEAERQRLERERLCIIKPVMTEAEIAQCKEVWR